MIAALRDSDRAALPGTARIKKRKSESVIRNAKAREAQKAEHSIGNREVASSIPAAGSLKVDGGLATDDRRRSSVIVSKVDSRQAIISSHRSSVVLLAR